MAKRPVAWLSEAVSDDRTGRVSTKRIVMLVAGISMSIGTLALVAAVYVVDADLSGPLMTFGASLSALAGGGYVFGKKYDQKAEAKETP